MGVLKDLLDRFDSDSTDDLEESNGFFSKEAGQARTAALNKFLNENLDYYLGPTGIPDRVRAVNELLNPVVGISDAGQSLSEGRYLDAVTDTAAAALPVAGAVAAKPLAKAIKNTTDEIAEASTAIKETLLGGQFNPNRRDFVKQTIATPAAASMVPVMDDVIEPLVRQTDNVFSPSALAKMSTADFTVMLNNLDEKMYEGELFDEINTFLDNPESMPEINNVLNEAQNRGLYEESAFNTFLGYDPNIQRQRPDFFPEDDPDLVPVDTNLNITENLPPASNSQRTQIAGTLPTYKKADAILQEASGDGATLDYGAGLGLSQRELGYDTFEPFPKEGFEPTFTSGNEIPSNSYNKITNLNVLNVVPKETRDEIVLDIGRILQPNGTAIITTRGRDVLNAKGTDGPEAMSIITSAGTYQKGFTQKELREYVQDLLGDNFEITNNKLGAAGITIRKKSSGTVEQQTDELLDTSRRVDTRLPTDPKGGEVDLVGTGTLITDTEALMKGNSKMAENFAMMTQSYPGLRNLWSEDVTETAQNIVSRMTDNIVSLYDMSERLGIAKDSANWYRGANRIALGLADRFGLEDTKTAGVLAALSPGKDWFQNVAMGERLIKHNAELGRNAPWTAEMDAVSTTVKASSGKKATTSWQDQPEFETVRGRPWGEMETPLQKAMWIRAYDEAHFGSNFREVNPNGDILGVVVTKSGSPSTLVHQSFTNMAKAIRILDGDGSLDSISPELGKAYKVRNFFNNILNPDSPKDVTVDTHQIAAGLFRPLGQSANEVNQGLVGASVKGNPNKFSNVGQPLTGMKGSYGLYFDGTTEAAKLRNVLPREMQSVSWEQLRTLFPKTLKSNKAFVTNVDAIWRMVDDGSLDPEGAREMIIAEAEKMGAGGVPSWKDYIGEKRDVGIATAGLIGAAGLATADEAEEEEGFASPQ
tara:strand:+ start:28 stop:2820 length:2793 start_codon:yes stop_codon:yes gene_type:complete